MALGAHQLLAGKLLPVLASTVIPDSDSHGTHDLILLSDDSGRLQNPSPLQKHEPEEIFCMGAKTKTREGVVDNSLLATTDCKMCFG
jgi:hypothetical protein